MTPGRYILSCFAGVATVLAVLTTINWFVDPLGYFGRLPFGLYHQDGLPTFKARLLGHDEYNAVLLGSSNSEVIGPEEVAPWGLKLFNASLLGLMPEDLQYYVQKFVNNQRTVIVAFDFYMVNEGCKPIRESEFARTEWMAFPEHAFSLKVTYYSLRALNWSWGGKGTLNFPTGNVNREAKEIANAQANGQNYGNWVNQTRDLFYCRFRYSDRRLEMIREIARDLERRDIRLLAYLSPMTPVMLDMLRQEGLSGYLARWRQDMKSILPGLVDFTDGPFSEARYFYWDDPLHYTRSTAKLVMERILTDEIGPPKSEVVH